MRNALVLPCAFVTALFAANAAFAHDFWVQPNEYWLTPQTTAFVTLQVGEGPSRQRSPIPLRRITRFVAIAPGGTTIDLHDRLHPGSEDGDGEFRFDALGAYVLVLQTDDRAQSHLPAKRFNAYLEEEGLLPALDQRVRTRRMDADGSEKYSRNAKALVQVGPPGAGSPDQVTKPVGLPLEIVPELNPYAEPRPAKLPLSVLYEGHPLAGARVKLTNLDRDAEPVEVQVTGPDGRTSFAMPREGRWLVNVVWTKPLPAASETDFATVFSSLSFGFPARP